MEQLENATPQLVFSPTPETTFDYSMPILPNLNFENLNLYENGYEIVEFRSISDGDTATFVVGGLPIATRFLAVDTPEVNSSTAGQEPWALAAKDYTEDKLRNAQTIILELDANSDIFDKYDRLLAWVWVDGELLNYMLVNEGLAYVKYLYGDYRYSAIMIKIEANAQKQKIKVWGELDPGFDYEDETIRADISTIRNLDKGKSVVVTGVVTNTIEKNAFIEYANNFGYAFQILDDLSTPDESNPLTFYKLYGY